MQPQQCVVSVWISLGSLSSSGVSLTSGSSSGSSFDDSLTNFSSLKQLEQYPPLAAVLLSNKL